jgi:uncharacterized protein (DUF2141 family)
MQRRRRRRLQASGFYGLVGVARAASIFFLFLLVLAAPASAAELTIRLCGMKNHEGSLRVTVFDRARAAEFTIAESKAFVADRTEKLKGRGWVPVDVVVPLPPGDYAVRVIHDENENGILDRDGWLTTPTESYGYSRNVRARVSAVEFDEAAVTLGKEPLTIDIRVAPWSLKGGDSSPCPK